MKSLDRLLNSKPKSEVLRGRIVDVEEKKLKVFLYKTRTTVEVELPAFLRELYVPEMTLTTTDSSGDNVTITIPKTYVQIDLETLIGREAILFKKTGNYFLTGVR